MFAILLALLAPLALEGPPQNDVLRGFGGGSQKVPLATSGYGGGVGSTNRGVDHATVAMNDKRDIVVAYHAERTGTGYGDLKQVEIAYYEYQDNAGLDTWVHLDTILLGGIDWHPIPGLPQQKTRCERPDVVAVRDKFFVVWTRRYESDLGLSGQDNGPAVIECAWVERAGAQQPYKVQTYPDFQDPQYPTKGLGFELDAHSPASGSNLFAKECLGVADAVPLLDGNEYKVAVAYPHQTDFSSPGNLNRNFKMRLVTCKLDLSNPTSPQVMIDNAVKELPQSIVFNGDTSPGPTPSAGLILPDLAPSSLENSFWLAYEGQVENASGYPNGRIRLEYWTLEDATNNTWVSTFGTTYKGAANSKAYVRRRPNNSSYPPSSSPGGEQMVSLAFNRRATDPAIPDQTAQVIYTEAIWQNGSSTQPPPPMVVGWTNLPSNHDGKPTVVRGRDSPYIRRCFADRDPVAPPPPSSLCEILSFNDITQVYSTIDSILVPPASGAIGRPAADYHYESTATNPDYIPVTWERKFNVGDPLEIWLGVE